MCQASLQLSSLHVDAMIANACAGFCKHAKLEAGLSTSELDVWLQCRPSYVCEHASANVVQIVCVEMCGSHSRQLDKVTF